MPAIPITPSETFSRLMPVWLTSSNSNVKWTRRLQRWSSTGYTLVEVMIGMTIFAIGAFGLLGATMMVRRAAEENVYNTMALSLAQSYMEQLRATPYSTLQNVAASSTVPVPLVNSAANPVTDTSGGGVTNNDTDWSQDIVYLDEDAAHNPIQQMAFRFKISLTDLATVSPAPGNGSTPVSGIEAVVTFQCTYNFGTVRVYNGTYRSVISGMPSY